MVNPTAILNDLGRARSWLSWAAAIGLIPWIIYLAHSLPRHYDTGHWRGLWVGFDVLEVVFLLTTAVLGSWGAIWSRCFPLPPGCCSSAMPGLM